jgi:hypothetical protein
MRVRYEGREYCLVGASGSAKDGKFYAVDARHEKLIAERFQKWPQAAITYFGILISDCKVVIQEPDVDVLVVEDHALGTNDCRGWISERLFGKLTLPDHRFYPAHRATRRRRSPTPRLETLPTPVVKTTWDKPLWTRKSVSDVPGLECQRCSRQSREAVTLLGEPQ